MTKDDGLDVENEGHTAQNNGCDRCTELRTQKRTKDMTHRTMGITMNHGQGRHKELWAQKRTKGMT